MPKLITYTQGQYDNFKHDLEADGYSVVSAATLCTTGLRQLDVNRAVCFDISAMLPLFSSSADDALAAHLEILCHQASSSTLFIADSDSVARYRYNIRTLFDEIEMTDVKEDLISSNPESAQKKRLTDLNDQETSELLDAFDRRLIGQGNFKSLLRKQISIFKVFNRIGEQPILSMLLLGPSGVGKTETARILSNLLAQDQPLPRVNFGNYSSKDALNSLIGSPRGYIGSENGELAMRINASAAGIILVDEFEKADSAVWNFFLDLLETGHYSDSQGVTYDLNGYIIVFTSNLSKEKAINTFPAELLSRFSLKIRFCPLSLAEKRQFVSSYVKSIINRFQERGEYPSLAADEVAKIAITDTDIGSIENIRVLKNEVRIWFVDFLEQLSS